MKRGVLISLLLLVLFCLTCLIIHNKTYSPKVAFFGDGITWGVDGASSAAGETTQVEHPYPELVQDTLRIRGENFGVQGVGWLSTQISTAFDYISTTNIRSYNAIVLSYSGTSSKKDIGSSDSSDSTTVMGQFNKSIRYIQDYVPSAKIIVIGPWRSAKSDNALLGKVLAEACDAHGIYYISQDDSPITEETMEALLPDGIHPSQEGYEQIASWLADKMKGILGVKYR